MDVKISRNVCWHFHELPDKFLMNFYSFFEWIFCEQSQLFLTDIWKDFLRKVKKFLVAFWCAFADIQHGFSMAICLELYFSFLSCSAKKLFDRCLISDEYDFWWTFWRFLLLLYNDFFIQADIFLTSKRHSTNWLFCDTIAEKIVKLICSKQALVVQSNFVICRTRAHDAINFWEVSRVSLSGTYSPNPLFLKKIFFEEFERSEKW